MNELLRQPMHWLSFSRDATIPFPRIIPLIVFPLGKFQPAPQCVQDSVLPHAPPTTSSQHPQPRRSPRIRNSRSTESMDFHLYQPTNRDPTLLIVLSSS